MFPVIQVDTASAKKADTQPTIASTGAYVCKILQAEIGVSQNGAQFVEFFVEDTESGGRAWTRLFLTKTTGEKCFGSDILNAIMVCAGLQKVTPTRGRVYDKQLKPKEGETYYLPEIDKKTVGLLLRREDRSYQATDGTFKDTWNMVIITAFEPKTRRTATEVLNNAQESVNLNRRLAQVLTKEAEHNRSAPQAEARATAADSMHRAGLYANRPPSHVSLGGAQQPPSSMPEPPPLGDDDVPF